MHRHRLSTAPPASACHAPQGLAECTGGGRRVVTSRAAASDDARSLAPAPPPPCVGRYRPAGQVGPAPTALLPARWPHEAQERPESLGLTMQVGIPDPLIIFPGHSSLVRAVAAVAVGARGVGQAFGRHCGSARARRYLRPDNPPKRNGTLQQASTPGSVR